MDADAKFDPLVEARKPLTLRSNTWRAATSIAQRTASTTLRELDDAAVAGPLDDAAMMHRNCGIDQVAAQGAQSRQSSIFVRARKVGYNGDHIGD